MHKATLDLLPGGLIRVSVPSKMKWTPGQHVFVRFLTSDLHLLTAHPFTISSACTDTISELVFYIKPRGGVTGRLRAMAAQRPGCTKRILVEGPYGGVSEPHMAQFDTILVIAGGSGGGFSLAMVDEALRVSGMEIAEQEKHNQRRNLQVVFSTRDHAMADWYIEEIERRLSESTMLASSDNGFETSVSVHVTGQRESGISSSSEDDLKSGKVPREITTTGRFSLNVHRNARPDLPGLLARTVAMAHTQGTHVGRKQRVGVLVCGPASMLHDTRNAAAVAQSRVFGGEIEELYLHSEPFV
jgi:ferredoxin-NADP reductase